MSDISKIRIGDTDYTINVPVSAITSTKLASNAVTSSKLASNAVTSTKIGSSAVTSAKIADASVTVSKLTTDIQDILSGITALNVSGVNDLSINKQGIISISALDHITLRSIDSANSRLTTFAELELNDRGLFVTTSLNGNSSGARPVMEPDITTTKQQLPYQFDNKNVYRKLYVTSVSAATSATRGTRTVTSTNLDYSSASTRFRLLSIEGYAYSSNVSGPGFNPTCANVPSAVSNGYVAPGLYYYANVNTSGTTSQITLVNSHSAALKCCFAYTFTDA